MMLGADIEFFIKNKSGGIIPAKLKEKIKDLHEDGFLGEMTIMPSSCREIVAMNLRNRYRDIGKYYEGGAEVTLSKIAHTIPKRMYSRLSEEKKMLGCAPEYSAYSGDIIQKPKETRLRSSGGHMHFGITKNITMRLIPMRNNGRKTFEIKMERMNKEGVINKTIKIEKEKAMDIVRHLDATLGLLDVVLCPNPRAERKRREVYGQPGAYRMPPWGIEYRVLSSWWAEFTPIISLYFLVAREVISLYLSNKNLPFLPNLEEEEIRYIIKEVDKERAKYNIKKLVSYFGKKENIDLGLFIKKSQDKEFVNCMRKKQERVNGIKSFMWEIR